MPVPTVSNPPKAVDYNPNARQDLEFLLKLANGTAEESAVNRNGDSIPSAAKQAADFDTMQAEKAAEFDAAQVDLYLARDQTQALRDQTYSYSLAATVALNPYATIALGLAGVASPNYFWVKPNVTDGLTRVTLYQNNSGVAAFITDQPNGNEVKAVATSAGVINANVTPGYLVEKLGREVTPVTGSNLGTNTYVFAKPIQHSGSLKRIVLFSPGTGSITFKRYSKSGDNFTQLAAVSMAVVAGVNDIGPSTFGTINVNAGEYLGFANAGGVCFTTNTADSNGYYASSGVVTDFTDTATTVNTRMEIGFEVQYLSASASRFETIASAMTKSEVVGRPLNQAPASGSTLSNNTYAFVTPVERDGTITRVRLFNPQNSSGAIAIKVFDLAGSTLTQIGSDYSVSVSAGYNDLTADQLPSISVAKGNIVGFCGYSGSGRVTFIAAPGDSGGYWASAGNVSTFVHGAAVTTTQLQIGMTVTADRLADIESRVTSNEGRLTAVEAQEAATAAQLVQTVAFTEALGDALGGPAEFYFGRPDDPVTGSAAASSTYVFAEPIPFAGKTGTIKVFAADAGGTLTLSLWTRNAGTGLLTKVSSNYVLSTVGGLNTFTAGVNYVAFDVQQGQMLGLYYGPHLAYEPLTAGDSGGFYSASGNVESFTDTSLQTNSRLGISVEVSGYEIIDAKARIEAIEAQLGDESLAYAVQIAGWNGSITYGQSNSLARYSNPALSVIASVINLTFNVGPKATAPALGRDNADDGAYKALVEDNNSPNAPGAYGESTCYSSTAATNRWLVDHGLAPAVFFASCAGRSGTGIAGLAPSGANFQNFQYHYEKAREHALSVGKTYSLTDVPFLHGEQDQSDGQTAAYYEPRFLDIVNATNTMARAVNQTGYVHFLCTLPSHSITLSQCAVETFQKLAKTNPLVHVVAPDYFIPRVADGSHYQNVGTRLLGSYIGRARGQLFVGQPIESFWFGQSVIAGNKLTIHCEFPGSSVVFDTSTLGAATQHGLYFEDGVGAISSTAITSSGKTIEVTLSRAPGSDFFWTYAQKYLGTGMNILDGASGNIRDNTTEPDMIGGVSVNRPHWAPQFRGVPVKID